jgi:DNA polymerase-3 subunit epsilon
MTRDDLRGMPCFRDIAGEFADFARGSEWIIHNAPFDVAFFDAEFTLCGMPPSAAVYARLVDTLSLARETFPGKRNNLDALCERFGVSNAHRTLHGALLDARLLAECYLAMTRGQESLVMELETPAEAAAALAAMQVDASNLIILPAAPDEVALHERYLDAMEKEAKGPALWRKLATAS